MCFRRCWVKEPSSFKNQFSQKTVYLNISIVARLLRACDACYGRWHFWRWHFFVSEISIASV